MLGEIIKRHVINRKVIVTALPIISLFGISCVFCVLYEDMDMELGKGIIIFIYGAIVTIIVVSLLYCFTAKSKIVGGIIRGILGAYFIWFLTLVLLDFTFRTDNDMLRIFLTAILAARDLILLFPFTLCVIASFLIAEFVERRLKG